MISPVSFVSYAPAIGSTAMSLQYQNSNMYTRMQNAGVMSTRIYTTVGASGSVGCTTAACPYGGAVKALQTAASYGMTGAWLAAVFAYGCWDVFFGLADCYCCAFCSQ